ncbi:DNA polymerase IV [Clostridium formicaceticum]|uniref:DNA polymerase IV n=1 Tax=Clostridium formicaceticum TaxID=1497 RepID=A0AAC9RPJ7_9CLOT|nr:DNA polymerase IV [Clostridium formicaceticum]AOY74571.1 DNA polymerase IV [Clostridium formicaceticum]ARE88930.1 DNA polymerase IV [Clostridium formicaceticum]
MQKVIFLVDMNAFFISCEMTRNPELIGAPAAVAGDPRKRTGIILAANYEARSFGVKTAMVLHEALKLCPNMKLIPPDHSFYTQRSREVMHLLSSYTPVIEQNSIDEAWLDMTGCERLLGKPLESAQKIMNNIRGELGLWCSIGISENKFLSKMASDMKKPLGITTLWKKDIEHKLWPLPAKSMYGIGKQTAEKLSSIGIETIGDLALFNQEFLIKKFGKLGLELHKKANGIDPSPVAPHSEDEVKSIGRSTTLSEDLSDLETATVVLMQLADEVGMTARQHNKKGCTVQIIIKYSNFQAITRQMTIPATYITKEIVSAGIQLLKQHWKPFPPVRLLGISLSGFDKGCKSDQISLFDLPDVNHSSHKEERLEKTMDTLRSKYGMSKINRATLIKTAKQQVNPSIKN